jgi:hypothetical protein
MLDTSQPHMAKTVKPENFKPGKLLDIVFAFSIFIYRKAIGKHNIEKPAEN